MGSKFGFDEDKIFDINDAEFDDFFSATTFISKWVQENANYYFGKTNSCKVGYLGNGEIDYYEIYSTPGQAAGDRLARVDVTYDGSLNPTAEAWKFYDSDGSTILKTVTLTHNWTGVDYDKSTTVVT